MKVARTVRTGGKLERAYLSEFGRGIYYGSYQAPRTLTWVIGAVILIAMMGTGFLGYVHSLKWSDINIIYLLTSLGLNLLEFQFLAFPYFGLFEAESFLIHFDYSYLHFSMSPKLYTILKNNNIKAEFVFENLHLAKSRDRAKNVLRGLAGIYIIINLVDGVSMYVGSASTNRLHSRLMMHLYYLKGNSRLATSVKELGRKNFAFVVVDIISEKISDKTNFTLLSCEQYFIDLLKPSYNILLLAGNSFGYKHTPDFTKNLRDNYNNCFKFSGGLKFEGFKVKFFKRNYSGTSISKIQPVKIYENADTQKLQILNENKNKSGIYQWKNIETGKTYVGSSTNLSKRLSIYYSLLSIENSLKKSKSRLLNALLKEGYSKFSLNILEYCEPNKCIEREQYYLDKLLPEYNILKIAGSSLGFKHSEESKNLMSKAAIKKYTLGEARKILSAKLKGENNPFFGKRHSEETRAKQSAAMKGKTHSAEIRKKISEAKKGIARPEKAGKPAQKISVFDIENNITTIYDSMHEAARAINIKCNVISAFIKNNQKKPYKGKYSFKKFEG
uniref:GIY-YIG domain-containing protein n=1 Tax=Orbilia brochopaga TaxID=3140254 RepID=A0A481ZMG5_9PEZI|nr:hypothetical protein [Drechslerella brochopaga]QBL02512.1 hypothetical protein [Drechslerella brochopaga]